MTSTSVTGRSAQASLAHGDLEALAALEKKVLWLATWTIHHANHIRENSDGLKVGGHQASSASLATIMTALYFKALRPQDRVAVKPHASPIFHAVQYLLGRQTREKLELFRGYQGAQSYPSRTKDTDEVDFSTGSVGLGVAQTLFSSFVQDYVRARGWGTDTPEGGMIALVGDPNSMRQHLRSHARGLEAGSAELLVDYPGIPLRSASSARWCRTDACALVAISNRSAGDF
jgi:pyruvate dehydrogenase complex dehydrogenase (E1) component